MDRSERLMAGQRVRNGEGGITAFYLPRWSADVCPGKPNRRPVFQRLGPAADDQLAGVDAAAYLDPPGRAVAELERARLGDPLGLAVAAGALDRHEGDEPALAGADRLFRHDAGVRVAAQGDAD